MVKTVYLHTLVFDSQLNYALLTFSSFAHGALVYSLSYLLTSLVNLYLRGKERKYVSRYQLLLELRTERELGRVCVQVYRSSLSLSLSACSPGKLSAQALIGLPL